MYWLLWVPWALLGALGPTHCTPQILPQRIGCPQHPLRTCGSGLVSGILKVSASDWHMPLSYKETDPDESVLNLFVFHKTYTARHMDR